MNEIVRKKLNLLVHLANIDGKFDQTEREVLASMLIESGIRPSEYSEAGKVVNLKDFDKGVDKPDILYWAMRLIKADGEIHSDEIAFCKALAIKMGFDPQIISHYAKTEIESKPEFVKKAKHFLASSV